MMQKSYGISLHSLGFKVPLLTGKRSTSLEQDYLGEELLGWAIVSDGFLIGVSDSDSDIAVGIKVVLVSKNLTWVLNLFAWVPFRGNVQFESISIVGQEVCVCLWLSKYIGCNQKSHAINFYLSLSNSQNLTAQRNKFDFHIKTHASSFLLDYIR